MICQFYPFPVTATVAAAAVSTVNVRSTSAATELAGIVEWILLVGESYH